MYLPEIYQKFSATFPEVFNIYQDLGKHIRDAGPLDTKTQDLIRLGIAIGGNSKGAVMSHTRKAMESGATREEVRHAVLLAMPTTGFPNMVAAFGWVESVLEKN